MTVAGKTPLGSFGMGVQPRVLYSAVGALLSLMLLVHLSAQTDTIARVRSQWGASGHRAAAEERRMNTTLGFEKIYVLNLPERSDKRDAMSLAAALSNISIEYAAGVDGGTIPDKALPHLQEHRPMPVNFLGSWRAHMNIIRDVLEAGVASALILEDDSDWDVRIKDQLADFAAGARWLQGTAPHEAAAAPYGHDWDVLWVGTCIDDMDAGDERAYVIHDDPTAPDYRELFHPGDVAADWITQYPPHSRIVHLAGEPMCTFAYAVSQTGARKLLYNLAVKELQGNFDNALAWMCRDKAMNARCFSVYPTLFHTHKYAGAAGKNSDNTDNSPEESSARTDEIQWPVKMNVEKLMAGRTDFQDHYPAHPPPSPPPPPPPPPSE